MKRNKPSNRATIEPTQCHLWTKKPLVWEDIKSFIEIERYIDESHFIRKLVKCSDCGQLYYYEFYEEIDWEEGNDPAYRNFFPINDINVVPMLNKLSYIDILQHTPRLLFYCTNNEKVFWVK